MTFQVVRSFCCAAIGALLIAAPSVAATNLDFETGDTSDWVSGGGAITGAVGSVGPYAPINGLFLGYAEGGQQDVYTTLSQSLTHNDFV